VFLAGRLASLTLFAIPGVTLDGTHKTSDNRFRTDFHDDQQIEYARGDRLMRIETKWNHGGNGSGANSRESL